MTPTQRTGTAGQRRMGPAGTRQIQLGQHSGSKCTDKNIFFLFFFALFSFLSAKSLGLQCWLIIDWPDLNCLTKGESLLVENWPNSRPGLLELHTPVDESDLWPLSLLCLLIKLFFLQSNTKLSYFFGPRFGRNIVPKLTVNTLRRGWEFFSVAFRGILVTPRLCTNDNDIGTNEPRIMSGTGTLEIDVSLRTK